MNRSLFATLLAVMLSPQALMADFSIRQSSTTDRDAAVAYNSTDHEYLAVWVEAPTGQMGPLMGQRISEAGALVGVPFTIMTFVSPGQALAYNPKKNEYLVVAVRGIAPDLGISGQRISATGSHIGTPVGLMAIGRYPRVVYNTLADEYLVLAVDGDLYSRRVDANGQPVSARTNVTNSPSTDHSRYAIAYAPIASTETPQGRFLVATQTNIGVAAMLLNSSGETIYAVYDPQSSAYFASLPLKTGTVVGGHFNVSVAYGDVSGYGVTSGKSFLVVWGDNNNTSQGAQWTGIWGAFVDAAKISYLTTDVVKDYSFPISMIYAHWAYSAYAETWKPVVVFNTVAKKFMVAWRETPGSEPQNDTKVNHIRANTAFDQIPPSANVVLSAISSNEDPRNPAIAASTTQANALVVWEDSRNSSATGVDIYGALYSTSAAPNTPAGTGVQVDPGSNVQLTFDNVTTSGSTTVTTSAGGSPPPNGFAIVPSGTPTYYSITTSASFNGNVKVCITYNDAGLTPQQEAALKLQVYEVPPGAWKDITTSLDVVNNIICGVTTHFSDFAIMFFSGGTGPLPVISTADAGPGTLRQAILDANSHPGADSIVFALPLTDPGYNAVGGYWTIKPLSSLPALTDSGTFLNGYSQTVFGGDLNPAGPEVELDGSQAGPNANGITNMAQLNWIGGLAINRFSGHGIYITGGRSNALLSNNYIGVDPKAKGPAGNQGSGVMIDNAGWTQIGWALPAAANIIGSNQGSGITIRGATSQNNGVWINYIGTDSSGVKRLGNKGDGILISDSAMFTYVTSFGVPPGPVIRYNAGAGIRISGAATMNNAYGGGSITQNQGAGLVLEGGANHGIGAPNITFADSGGVIGTAPSQCLVALYADDEDEGREFLGQTYSTASGYFAWMGVVKGPYVTATAIDTGATPPYRNNVSMFSSPWPLAPPHSLFVTTTSDTGVGSLRQALEKANAQSGADSILFHIPQTDPNYHAGTGVWTIRPKSTLPYINDPGLFIDGGSQAAYIGMETNPEGPEIEIDGSNVPSGTGLAVFKSAVDIRSLTINRFTNYGILFHSVDSGWVRGCFVGTDNKGMTAAANGIGVSIYQSRRVVVLPQDLQPTILSGNSVGGVVMAGHSRQNFVGRNFIGVNREGTTKIGNASYGVYIYQRSDSNAVVDNVVGGNSIGVCVGDSSRDNLVEHNFIGAEPGWTKNLGNSTDGVQIIGASQRNRVVANLIGYNKGHGVRIKGAATIANKVTGNRISQNDSLGIENVEGGNLEITPPTILSVTPAQVTGKTAPNRFVEVFTDEGHQGRFLLGSSMTDSAGGFTIPLSSPVLLAHVTATGTDAAGNTSEFGVFTVTDVSREHASRIPLTLELSQNFPNPFNPSTTIRYGLPHRSQVSLVVYNTLGQLVSQLVNGEEEAGYHEVKFQGSGLSSGVYFYRLSVSPPARRDLVTQERGGQAADFVQTRKLLLIR